MRSNQDGLRGVGRVIASLLAVCGLMAAFAVPAIAGPGVKLSYGKIEIDPILFIGTAYQLPAMTVSNPGTISAEYHMSVVPYDGDLPPIPSDWITLTPEGFVLDPGESQRVEASLVVPDGARLGSYEGLVAAQMNSGTDADGANGTRLGAGAAATLTFAVGARTLLEAWASNIAALWQDAGAWAYLSIGAIALGVLVIWFRTRFAIRILARSG